tara:strand:+ start:5289 stop:7295 length:2007 start_codon:yes stop_codon:yes gene_type:complete
MLGAGIFVFPGLAGGNAGFAAIISFLTGGVIALFVAACTAELATAMPQSGGGYFFISRSFGPFWGTMTGIAQWIGLIFASAFYLVSFGEYATTFLTELNISWTKSTKILSFCFILLLLVINIIGTKKVGRFQNLMVITLTIILTLIFSYGLIDFLGFEDKPVAFSEIAPNGIKSIFTTTALIFTAYLGFVQIANIGAEIKQPSKNLPRSLISSVIIAICLYVFIMTVCVVTYPQEELKKFGETATIEVARKMLGNWGAIVVVFAGLLAALSSANASMISASRGVFALSKDKIISKKASKISKRFGTPHMALILVAVPIMIMLIRSKLEVFAEVASSLHLIIYAGICMSVFRLRITNPIWYIPTFRVPAAKVVAGLGAVSCLILLYFMQKTSILISLAVLVLAMAYYFLYVRKRKIRLTKPEPPHIDADLFNPSILIPVDINQEKKNLPHTVLEAMPISKLLLLGFKETPEQSDSEQSEEEFRNEGEKKLDTISSQLEKAQIDFDLKLIFSNKIATQIKQFIEEENLQFILTLKPLSDLNQLIIPIYDLSQINTKLSTIIYNLHSNKPTKIKVLIFTKDKDGSSDEAHLRNAMTNQLALLNINVDDFEVYLKEKESPQKLVQKISKKNDLIIWSEVEPSQREFLFNIILEKEKTEISSPSILILKSEGN